MFDCLTEPYAPFDNCVVYRFNNYFIAYRWSAKPNVFDSRLRPWYIQAATCSKDVVILSDISGSMYGMHQSISSLVMRSLLMTFNNDDSINIIYFNTTTFYIVPCFTELLVQVISTKHYNYFLCTIYLNKFTF